MQNEITNAQLSAGYAVTCATGTAPIWSQGVEGWLSILSLSLAVLVGAATLYLNIMKIKKLHRDDVRQD